MLVVLWKKNRDYNIRVAEIDTKVSSLDGKIAENKTKDVSIENEFKKLIKNLVFFLLANILFDRSDGSQAYLILQPVHKYIKVIANTKLISEWKSKELSAESIKPFPTSNNSLTALIDNYDHNIRVKFNESI